MTNFSGKKPSQKRSRGSYMKGTLSSQNKTNPVILKNQMNQR